MNIRSLLALTFLLAFLAGCNGRESAWQDAQEADTPGAYRQYLESYPDSPQAQEARQRMQALQRERLWLEATQTGSVDAYRRFIDQYPDSEQAAQAQARIEELEREEAWQRLRESTDAAALRSFADRHSGTPAAQQARQRADELEAAARGAEEQARREEEQRRAEEAARTHRVQLAAFRTEERAARGVEELQSAVGGLLDDAELEVTRSGSYFLVATPPMAEHAAQSLCQRLKDENHDCLVVNR